MLLITFRDQLESRANLVNLARLAKRAKPESREMMVIEETRGCRQVLKRLSTLLALSQSIFPVIRDHQANQARMDYQVRQEKK